MSRIHSVIGSSYCKRRAEVKLPAIEFTRNVLGVPDADSAENNSGSANIVITLVACPIPAAGGLRLAGEGTARPVPGTLFAQICGTEDLRGEYFCSFETNAAFIPRWLAAGLRVAANGSDGEMRAFEIPSHRFFLATLFQPQLSSEAGNPHPLIRAFAEACAARR